MTDVARFAYTSQGGMGAMPFIPITLESRGSAVYSAIALLDTGAAISILPNSIAINLRLDWQELEAYPVRLGGVFRGQNGCFVKLKVSVGQLPVQEIVFAWLQSGDAPLILGNANFFEVFDTCFSRSNDEISVRLGQGRQS